MVAVLFPLRVCGRTLEGNNLPNEIHEPLLPVRIQPCFEEPLSGECGQRFTNINLFPKLEPRKLQAQVTLCLTATLRECSETLQLFIQVANCFSQVYLAAFSRSSGWARSMINVVNLG